MPSSVPLPTLAELESAFHAGVGSERKGEDQHLGSFYDRFGGAGALGFRQLAESQQGNARAVFFDTAANEDLDHYVEIRSELARVDDAPGTGTVTLTRPSGATGGSVLAGTRIEVNRGPGTHSQYWKVTADFPVAAGRLLAVVPVTAMVDGPDGQVALSAGQVPIMRVADPLWDNTWSVSSILCDAGTIRQKDSEFRAAVRQEKLDARPGYVTAIVKAMKGAGAAVVAMFEGNFLSSSADVGLNRIYVGDASYRSPAALLTACRLQVPNVCVAGSSAQTLPMTSALLYCTVTIRLWVSPGTLNQVQYDVDSDAAVLEYFARRDNAFLWSAAAIRTAVMKAVPNIHTVTVSMFTDSARTVLAAEPVLASLFATSPLVRYGVAEWSVRTVITGPDE